MTTEAISSLGCEIYAMVLVVAFSFGMAALKRALLRYCRNGNRHDSKCDHTQTTPGK